MKKKMRKFADGGFTKEQEEWLGGADRTDPFILARMRAAVPDEKTVDAGYGEQDEMPEIASTPKEATKTVVKTKISPSKKTAEKTVIQEEKKPYIDIPKDTSIGMRQFRSDGVSPMEKLFKSISGKSQRTTAAEKKMAKGGSVKASSASRRGDGCAQRGKTKGRMV